MDSDIVQLIQHYFKMYTKSKISKKDAIKFILPIIDYINSNQYNKILLSGSQGVGKTTILKIIEIIFKKKFEKNILSLSLDDFYIDREERKKLSFSVNPLLATRGVPGTHNIKKILEIISKFDNSIYPLKIPIFDKLKDNSKKTKRIIRSKCDILILEGWCLGCPPLTDKYLLSNINFLEKNLDTNKNWRTYYNNQLKGVYSKLFNKFDISIFMKSPSFKHTCKWRLKQENQLIKKNNSSGMSKKEVLKFVQYYEKITKWMLKEMPKNANLVLYINKKQKINRIIKN